MHRAALRKLRRLKLRQKKQLLKRKGPLRSRVLQRLPSPAPVVDPAWPICWRCPVGQHSVADMWARARGGAGAAPAAPKEKAAPKPAAAKAAPAKKEAAPA